MPRLREEFGLKELWVFGSMARGDDHDASDVDVLVEFQVGARPTLLTLAALMGRLSELLGREVDVGELRSLRSQVREEVEREMLRVA
ncbi:MAG: nucleotidyltransferase family protein [Phycisphaerales bacterium]|nr:nucleotidyltransferase family protein [Phycisphaerales bacterium]